MDLSERLKQTFGTARELEAQAGEAQLALSMTLPGRAMQIKEGTFWLRTKDYPLNLRHGHRSLEEMLGLFSDRLVDLTGDEGLSSFESNRAVFLDTETTSLSGGAGVFVFMAGIGFVHRNQFRVEQYFMRDYDEEPAMLSAFNERCAAANCMVSFFGKTFDRYRLEDRMGANGIKSELPVDCHLDLYHVGRRLFQGRHPNLKLKTLEANELGFLRKDDISGEECPNAYFDFLSNMKSSRIADVFKHNLWDILSLAVLAAEVDDIIRFPKSAQDRYTLACIQMRNKKSDKALSLLQDACLELTSGPLAFDAHMRMARLLKRCKETDRWKEVLRKAVELCPENPEGLTEMSKYLEHRGRNYDEALEYAKRAQASLLVLDNGSSKWARQMHDSAHRIERLKLKHNSL